MIWGQHVWPHNAKQRVSHRLCRVVADLDGRTCEREGDAVFRQNSFDNPLFDEDGEGTNAHPTSYGSASFPGASFSVIDNPTFVEDVQVSGGLSGTGVEAAEEEVGV